jgi:hypothetical protein
MERELCAARGALIGGATVIDMGVAGYGLGRTQVERLAIPLTGGLAMRRAC